MSIVIGTSGQLSNLASGIALTTANCTILVWVKDANTASGLTACYVEFKNTSSNYIRLRRSSTPAIQAYWLQQFAASANQTTLPASNSWFAAATVSKSSNNVPEVSTASGTVVAGGQHGAYQTQTASELYIGVQSDAAGRVPSGSKIGAIAIFSGTLSSTERDELTAGADPLDYTGIVAYWNDGQGVTKDGSDNLISWTDIIDGIVLTPSGTVTVDTADPSPIYDTGAVTPSITTVGSDNSATIGAATAVTVNGFPSAINAGTCDGVALTAASNTSITLPGFVDEQQCPMAGNAADGTARDLSLTDGSQTANKSIDVNTPEIVDNPGVYWAATTLVDPLDMTDASVVKDFAVAGDIMYTDPTKGIMYSDGTFDAFESEQTFWHHQASTRIVRSVAFAVYSVAPADLSVSVDFTAPSLTTGITVSADDLISVSSFDAASLSYIALISPGDSLAPSNFSSPTLLLGYSIQPDDLALAISYTAPGLTLGYAVQPGDLVSTTLFSSPSLLLGFAVQPADLYALGAFSSPVLDVSGPASITPDNLDLVLSLTQPALVTDYSVQPLNLSALSVFSSPYINNSTGPIKAGVLVIVKPQTLIIEVLQ